jgi:subtilase family serine protease
MRRFWAIAALSAAGALLASCNGGTGTSTLPSAAEPQPETHVSILRSCAAVLPGDHARCFAELRTDLARGLKGVRHDTTPSGYGPSQLQSAYALPSSTNGSGQTVAIVDAYNDPNAASDLSVYRSQFGLPACTTASGCFEQVSQTGSKTKLPKNNGGWAEEESLDMDMVSAICPNCKIILVEASSATIANLEKAEDEAVALGANIVTNSYGGSEYAASDPAFSHAGVVIVASAGDDGYAEGSLQPCSFASVVCAGGTSLTTANNARGWSEVVWNDSYGATGSGCSSEVSKPSWQTDKGCTKRSQSDVSFDADPATGVAVYDSYAYEGYEGWLVFGGTSVASPSLASVFALAGNASSLGPSAAQPIWNDAGSGLNSVTSGNNGSCPSTIKYICTAGTGDDGVYSGPAGWGTPNGISDF